MGLPAISTNITKNAAIPNGIALIHASGSENISRPFKVNKSCHQNIKLLPVCGKGCTLYANKRINVKIEIIEIKNEADSAISR
jgi:hypothetical protein